MAKYKWSDITATPEYQGDTPEGREKTRAGFFERNVAPDFGPDQIDRAREDWDKATLPKPAKAAPGVKNPDSNLSAKPALERPTTVAEATPGHAKGIARPKAAKGDEGFIEGVKDFGRGLVKGTVQTLPEGAAGALDYADTPEFDEQGKLVGDDGEFSKFAREMRESAEKRGEDWQQSEYGRQMREKDAFSVRGSAYEAGEMTPLSFGLTIAGAVAGGVLTKSMAGVRAGASIGGLASLPLFFGLEAKESYDQVYEAQLAQNPDMTDEEAHDQAMKAGGYTGAIEAGGEFLADRVGLSLFKHMPSRVKKDLVKQSTKAIQGVVPMAKGMAKILGAEVATELAQGSAQAEVMEEFGVGEGAKWDEQKRVIMPTILMSMVGGGASMGLSGHQRYRVAKELQNPKRPPEDRLAAAEQIAGALAQEDAELANMFYGYAAEEINAGRPVIIDDDRFYRDLKPLEQRKIDKEIASGQPPAGEGEPQQPGGAPDVGQTTVTPEAEEASLAPGEPPIETSAPQQDVMDREERRSLMDDLSTRLGIIRQEREAAAKAGNEDQVAALDTEVQEIAANFKEISQGRRPESTTREKEETGEPDTTWDQGGLTGASEEPAEPRPVLQNRNRATAASVEQMTGIAANPDYTRLGFSRDFANGAPVVEPGAEIYPDQLGKEDVATTAGGRHIPVQYAVVEAAQLLPSNTADGSRIPEYEQGQDGLSRAIAGNGRVAGLQRAYEQGNSQAYLDAMAADEGLHGISASTIQAMENPVLVRIMPQEEITDTIGDESNTSGTAELSPAEQARNDTRRIDIEAVELGEDGEPTKAAVEQFIASMPAAERAGLMDGKRANKRAYDRLGNAVFAEAFDSDELLRLAAEATEPEIRTIMSALKIAAGKMSRLKGTGVYDIRPLIIEAAETAVNAKRNGETLAQFMEQGDMGRNPYVTPILEMMAENVRSAKKMGENLSNLADVFYDESARPDEDMFGDVEKRPPQQLMDEIYGTGQIAPADEADAVVEAGPDTGEGGDAGQRPVAEIEADVEQPETGRREEEPLADEIDAAAAELADLLKPADGESSGNFSVNEEVNPQVMAAGTKLGGLYINQGTMKFEPWARAIIEKLSSMGVDPAAIKPHLKSIYAATQQTVSDEQYDQMDDARTVRNFDLDSLDSEQPADTGQPGATTDLFGAVPVKEQSLADLQREKDEKRGGGGQDVPADIDGGLFSNQQDQANIFDVPPTENQDLVDELVLQVPRIEALRKLFVGKDLERARPTLEKIDMLTEGMKDTIATGKGLNELPTTKQFDSFIAKTTKFAEGLDSAEVAAERNAEIARKTKARTERLKTEGDLASPITSVDSFLDKGDLKVLSNTGIDLSPAVPFVEKTRKALNKVGVYDSTQSHLALGKKMDSMGAITGELSRFAKALSGYLRNDGRSDPLRRMGHIVTLSERYGIDITPAVPKNDPLRKKIEESVLTAEEIEAKANEAATSPENNLPEPTEAQIEADNYKKGEPFTLHGQKIVIENPKGSERKGTDASGKAWSNTMGAHYGDIKGTVAADGDNLDVFVGENPESERIFIIDQQKNGGDKGGFDEHKVFMGFVDQAAAEKAYLDSYDKGWGLGPISELTVDQFKEWINNGNHKKPYQEKAPARTAKSTEKSRKDKAKRNQATNLDRVENYFQPGRIVNTYGGELDKVISFDRGADDGMWSVTVVQIDETGEPAKGAPERNHSTAPSERDLKRWEQHNPVGPSKNQMKRMQKIRKDTDEGMSVDQIIEEFAVSKERAIVFKDELDGTSETSLEREIAKPKAKAKKRGLAKFDEGGKPEAGDYYISSGAFNEMYTLRTLVKRAGAMGESRVFSSYVGNLSTDFKTAVQKAREYLGPDKRLTGAAFELGKIERSAPRVKVDGKAVNPGEVTFNFGKHSGDTLADVLENDPDYLMWIKDQAEQGADWINRKSPEIAAFVQELEAPEAEPPRIYSEDERRSVMDKWKVGVAESGDHWVIKGVPFEINGVPSYKAVRGVFGSQADFDKTGDIKGWRIQGEYTREEIESRVVDMLLQAESVEAGEITESKKLREEADKKPSEELADKKAMALVSDETAKALRLGENFGIPKNVVDDQVADVGKILDAYNKKKGIFLLANEAGTGKTFVLGGAIREMRDAGAKKFVYVTMNQDLIAQIKKDLEPYGVEDVQFDTYANVSTGKSDVDTNGAVLIFDETHQVGNIESARGKRGQDMMQASEFTVMASATPFENPAQAEFLAGTGFFENNFGGDYYQWLMGHGGTVKYFGDKPTPVWTGTKEDGKAARQFMFDRGVMTYRPMQIPAKMVDSTFIKQDVEQKWVDLYNQVDDAYALAMDAAGDGGRDVSSIKMHRINVLKRILEASKVEAGIKRAQDHLEAGLNPIIFVETKSDRHLGRFRKSGAKQSEPLYEYPEINEMMLEWLRAADAAAANGDRPPPPPFATFIWKVASAFYEKGIDFNLPSTTDDIISALGKKNVAIYTGSVTNTRASKNLVEWREGDKKVLVATMDKGGTGLSLHDTVGDHPTAQVNINLPWVAKKVDQVAGRSARYGLQSKAHIEWLFAGNIPFEEELAGRVGRRMADMGAVVKGNVDVKAATTLTDEFDFEGAVDTREDGDVVENINIDDLTPLGGEAVDNTPDDEPPGGKVVVRDTLTEEQQEFSESLEDDTSQVSKATNEILKEFAAKSEAGSTTLRGRLPKKRVSDKHWNGDMNPPKKAVDNFNPEKFSTYSAFGMNTIGKPHQEDFGASQLLNMVRNRFDEASADRIRSAAARLEGMERAVFLRDLLKVELISGGMLLPGGLVSSNPDQALWDSGILRVDRLKEIFDDTDSIWNLRNGEMAQLLREVGSANPAIHRAVMDNPTINAFAKADPEMFIPSAADKPKTNDLFTNAAEVNTRTNEMIASDKSESIKASKSDRELAHDIAENVSGLWSSALEDTSNLMMEVEFEHAVVFARAGEGISYYFGMSGSGPQKTAWGNLVGVRPLSDVDLDPHRLTYYVKDSNSIKQRQIVRNELKRMLGSDGARLADRVTKGVANISQEQSDKGLSVSSATGKGAFDKSKQTFLEELATTDREANPEIQSTRHLGMAKMSGTYGLLNSDARLIIEKTRLSPMQFFDAIKGSETGYALLQERVEKHDSATEKHTMPANDINAPDDKRKYEQMQEAQAEWDAWMESNDLAGSYTPPTDGGLFRIQEVEQTQTQKNGDLKYVDKNIRKAVLSALKREPKAEAERIRNNLEEYKATAWSVAAIKGLALREYFHLATEGKADSAAASAIVDSDVWGGQKMRANHWIKAFAQGPGVVEGKIALYDEFISNNRKAELSLSGSWAECNPTRNCARHCYAADGQGGAPTSIIKAEIVEWAARYHPEIFADNIETYYGMSALSWAGLSLRLNDKGDLSPALVRMSQTLAARGVPMQIFTKRPELLADVPSMHLRMVSVDSSSDMAMIARYPEYQLAITLTDEMTDEMLLPLLDRAAVILPVNLKGHEWSMQEIKKQWPQSFEKMKKAICPVESGLSGVSPGASYVQITDPKMKTPRDKKGKKAITCTSCDLLGSHGCFYGANQTVVRKAESLAVDLSAQTAVDRTISRISLELSRLVKQGALNNDEKEAVIKSIREGGSAVSGIVDPGAAAGPGKENSRGPGGAAKVGEKVRDGAKRIIRKGANNKPLRGATSTRVNVEDIQGIVNKIGGNWGVGVNVIPNMDGLPENAKMELRRQGITSAITGYYDREKQAIYLVAEGIRNKKEAEVTLLHEAVGHMGIERVMGLEINDFLKNVYDIRESDPAVKEAWDYVNRPTTYGNAPQVVQAAEIVARIAESNPKHTLVQRLVQMARQALRKMGFDIIFKNDDIIEALRQAKRSMTDGSYTGKGSQGGLFGVSQMDTSNKPERAAKARAAGYDLSKKLYLREVDNDGRAGITQLSEEPLEGANVYYANPGKTLDVEGNKAHRDLAIKLFNEGGGWGEDYMRDTNQARWRTRSDQRDSDFSEIEDQDWELFDNLDAEILFPLLDMGYTSFRFKNSAGNVVLAFRNDEGRIIDSDMEPVNGDDPAESESPNILARVQESPEFQNWFRDSKAVDESGKPLTLYHATPGDFSEFYATFDGPSGPAFFFTDRKDRQPAFHNIGTAKRGEFKTGTNVMPVYLSIQNPLVIDTPEKMQTAQEKYSTGKGAAFPLVLTNEQIADMWVADDYDGVIIKSSAWGGREDTASEYIAFWPEQIKSIWNQGSFDDANRNILFRVDEEQAPPFYSGLKRAAQGLKQEKGTPEQMIGAMKKQGGVKDDEIEWTGLREFLNLQGGTVTKDQIISYLDANGVEVETTILGYTGNVEDVVIESGLTESEAETALTRALNEDGSAEVFIREDADGTFSILEEVPTSPTETVWNKPDLVLPGGDNYREILLKLPMRNKETHYTLRIEDINALSTHRFNTREEAQEFLDKLIADGNETALGSTIVEVPRGNSDYAGSHFSDQYNVLSHIRANDRVGQNGEKVLFIEEIQSDWHQAGKKEGYAANSAAMPILRIKKEAATERLENARIAVVSLLEENNNFGFNNTAQALNEITQDRPLKAPATESDMAVIKEWLAAKDDRIDILNQINAAGLVPDAPFKGNAWVELAAKRMIRLAAEEGYDRIAWTTGQQQADRYDLSKRVEAIKWELMAGGKEVYISMKPVDTWENDGAEDAEGYHDAGRHTIDKLDEVVGKELADKIRDEVEETKKPVQGMSEAATAYAKYMSQRTWESEEKAREYLSRKIMKGNRGDPDSLFGYVDPGILDEFTFVKAGNEVKISQAGMKKRNKRSGVFSGIELEVGGEGLRSFYDRNLKNTFSKVAKKLGKDARVSVEKVHYGNQALRSGTFKFPDDDFATDSFLTDVSMAGFESMDYGRHSEEENVVTFENMPQSTLDVFVQLAEDNGGELADSREQAKYEGAIVYGDSFQAEDNYKLILEDHGKGGINIQDNRIAYSFNNEEGYESFYGAVENAGGDWRNQPKEVTQGEGFSAQGLDVTPAIRSGAMAGQGMFRVAESEQTPTIGDKSYASDYLFRVREKPAPKKKVKAYKLFRLKKGQPGKLFPLFVKADEAIEPGTWLDAESGDRTPAGKVKSKIGALAYRPGWHTGDSPIATHIGIKVNKTDKAPTFRNPEHVWAEVEVGDDVDWQTEANKRAEKYKNGPRKGKIKPVTAHITDQVPEDGFYRYKTNHSMEGNWLIAGTMRVNRLLSDAEVEEINKKNGYSDLPRQEPMDFRAWGFAEDGALPGSDGPVKTKTAGMLGRLEDVLGGGSFRVDERQVESPEFKKWFRDSKVVEPNGEPKVMYRGTRGKRASFHPNEHGLIYLAGDKALADKFAEGVMGMSTDRSLEPVTESVYVRAENPLDVINNPTHRELFMDVYGETQLTSRDDPKQAARGYEEVIKQGRWTFFEDRKTIDRLKELGFDGFWNYEYPLDTVPDQTLALAVFDPAQIKSTNNQGTFDPSDNRIMFRADERQIESPEFKKWFGKSQVTDPDGKPLVVYRGEHGKTDQQLQTRSPVYTFGDRDTASEYAMDPNKNSDRTHSPRVIPAYLKIEKPFMQASSDPFLDLEWVVGQLGRSVVPRIVQKYHGLLEDTNWWHDPDGREGGKSFQEEYGTVRKMWEEAPEKLIKEGYLVAYPVVDDFVISTMIKDKGFDGIIHGGYGYNSGEVEYKVFTKRNIKSAIGNRGTFSPDNPNILFRVPEDTAGLDMSEDARLGRAEEMGFDTSTVWYHGAPDSRGIWEHGFRSVKENLLGEADGQRRFFFAKSKRTADTYADDTRAFDYQNSVPETIPVYLRPGNNMEIDWQGRPFRGTRAGQSFNVEDAINEARDSGYDSVTFRNIVDDYRSQGTPDTIMVVLDPANIRNTDAAFDPRKDGSRNILFRVAEKTDTPEFKEWFADSKVVEKGKPAVVYHHGTFTQDDNYIPSMPMHFGTKPAAEQRAFDRSQEIAAREVSSSEDDNGRWHWYAPGFSSEDYGDTGFDSQMEAQADGEMEMREVATNNPDFDPNDIGTFTEVYLSIQNPKRVQDQVDREGWDKAITEAKAQGHDGIVYTNKFEDKGSTSWIAFNPEQVKSVNNKGAFDARNPNILFRVGSPEGDKAETRRNFLKKAANVAVAAAVGAPIARFSTTEKVVKEGVRSPIKASSLSKPLPKAVVSRLGDNDVVGALNIIAKTGPVAVRELASKLADLNTNNGVSVQIEYVQDGYVATVNGSVEQGRRGGAKMKLYQGEKNSGLDYDTFLHESAHLAVMARYSSLNRSAAENFETLGVKEPQAREAIEQFNKLYKEFRNRFYKRKGEKLIGAAMAKPDEFLAYALTSPDFQAELSKVRYQGKTLYERFKDWVKFSLFNMRLEGSFASWLDAGMAASEDLLAAMKKDDPNFEFSDAMVEEIGRQRGQNEIFYSAGMFRTDDADVDVYVPEPVMRPWKAWLADRLESFRFEYQDKLIDLKRIQKQAPPQDHANAYQKASIWEGRAGERLNDFDENRIQPLLQTIAESGMEWGDIGKWLVARHAKEANAYLAEINPDIEGEERYRLSGMSNEEAEAILEQHSDRALLWAVGDAVDQINRERVDMLVSEGLITEQMAAQWRGRYDAYVPLFRQEAMENTKRLPGRGQGFNISGNESRMRTGSAHWTPDQIVTNVIAQYQASIVRAEKNKVGLALLEYVKQNPDPSFWNIDTERKIKVVRNGKVIEVPRGQDAIHELSVKKDGEQHYISFNQDNIRAMRLVSGLKNLQAREMGSVMRALATATRYLSTVNTSWNPEFIVSNFARDIQTAAYNMSDTEIAGMRAAVIKDVPAAIRGIKHALFDKNTESEWGRAWDDFRKHGGKTGWIDLHGDVLKQEKNLQEQAARLAEGKPSRTAIRRFLTAVDNLNAVVENGVRLAAYQNAIKPVSEGGAGLSKDKAAALAKDLTVNFNRKGNRGAQVNALYMFYNASIQGNVRLLQALVNSKQGRRLAMATVGLAVTLDIINRAMSGDDDDGENIYDTLPDYIKDHNLVIMGEKEPIVKIPLPWGYNVLHTVGQSIGQAITGDDFSAFDSATRIALAGMNAFNPIGGGTVLQTISPTVLDPIAMIGENKTFMNTPLKPEHTYDSRLPRPEYQMHWASSREASNAITKFLNDASGGNEVTPGFINLSPEWLDLVLDTFTGGAGKTAANTLDTAGRLVTGEEIPIENIPFVRKVTGYNIEHGIKSRYYDWSKGIAYTKAEAKTLKGKEAAKVRKKPEYRLVSLYTSSEKQLSGLRKMRRDLVKHNASQERIDRIDAKIRSIMAKFNKKYAEVMRDG